MPRRVIAYIGLGSNLAEPLAQVEQALAELQEIPESRMLDHSRLYLSEPMGPLDQPDYINAVAALETALTPQRLLSELQAIEHRHGRKRGVRWGARTLDLDLLLYGEQMIDEELLTVPHPGLAERPFVLYPLAEIAPALAVPGMGKLTDLLAQCPPGELKPHA